MNVRLKSSMRCLTLVALWLLGAGVLALAQSAAPSDPKESLDSFINPQAADTATKLEVIQQEIYQAEQETIVQGFVQEYGQRDHLKRVLYASGSELIPGYVFTPVDMVKGKRYPAILLLHGGNHEKLDWRFFRYIDSAVAKGFVVLFPEYRGSRGYGENQYINNYGVSDLEDVLAGAEYLSHQDFVDSSRLGIIGHSRGGMLTMSAIEREPKRFKAAVEIAGIADLVVWMGYKPEFRRADIASQKNYGGKLPNQNLQPYIDVSPINHVDSIETPLLIVGTTMDNEVPFSTGGGRMMDAMKARGKVFESKIYDKAPGGHVFLFGDTPDANDCLDRSLAFLAKYLKP